MHFMPPRDTSRFGDYELLEFESLDRFHEAVTRPGLITIDYNGSPLDILRIDKGSDTTVVVFHSSLSQSVRTIPVFSGLGVLSGMHANIICVSDPTLELNEKLKLAWFAGNSKQHLQRDLPQILGKLLDEQSAKHVIFFGASGGGFASMYYSAAFPDSLAIPLNPQTNIRRFPESAVLSYARVAFGARSIEQARNHLINSITDDLRDVYRSGSRNTIAYVQNYMDTHHVYRHMQPFLSAIPRSGNTLCLVDDWGFGHVAPPGELSRGVLEAAINSDGHWQDALVSFGFTSDPAPELPVRCRESKLASHLLV